MRNVIRTIYKNWVKREDSIFLEQHLQRAFAELFPPDLLDLLGYEFKENVVEELRVKGNEQAFKTLMHIALTMQQGGVSPMALLVPYQFSISAEKEGYSEPGLFRLQATRLKKEEEKSEEKKAQMRVHRIYRNAEQELIIKNICRFTAWENDTGGVPFRELFEVDISIEVNLSDLSKPTSMRVQRLPVAS